MSNIEALANWEWGTGTGEGDGFKPCYVGYICYVLAEFHRYCGNCEYAPVDAYGDGMCQ